MKYVFVAFSKKSIQFRCFLGKVIDVKRKRDKKSQTKNRNDDGVVDSSNGSGNRTTVKRSGDVL
jgi:hypothetical protein